jgi:hypothetical protein
VAPELMPLISNTVFSVILLGFVYTKLLAGTPGIVIFRRHRIATLRHCKEVREADSIFVL